MGGSVGALAISAAAVAQNTVSAATDCLTVVSAPCDSTGTTLWGLVQAFGPAIFMAFVAVLIMRRNHQFLAEERKRAEQLESEKRLRDNAEQFCAQMEGAAMDFVAKTGAERKANAEKFAAYLFAFLLFAKNGGFLTHEDKSEIYRLLRPLYQLRNDDADLYTRLSNILNALVRLRHLVAQRLSSGAR